MEAAHTHTHTHTEKAFKYDSVFLETSLDSCCLGQKKKYFSLIIEI